MEGFWGSNLLRPWLGALVGIRWGPKEPGEPGPLARIRQVLTGVFFCGAEGRCVRHSENEQIMK